MDELQIAAQRSWIIISTCIIVVLAVSAIVVLIWWIVMNYKDFKRDAKMDAQKDIDLMKHNCETFAAAADAGWSQYIDMKDKCNSIKDEYSDYKDKVEQWDKKRSERIRQLEKQLRDNGITPIPWDLGEIA